VRKNVHGCQMKVLHLSIPPLPRFAGTARRAFSKFAGFHRVGRRDVENLLFALGEAIANAIAHAQTGDAIEIHIQMHGDSIVAIVSDRGCGFADPPQGPFSMPSLYAQAGRGFAIMQLCTDFLEVESKAGAGTVVTLGRYRRDRQELETVS
jgi:anti-sigma regulatory factor (Ser/Thr protein kinase)